MFDYPLIFHTLLYLFFPIAAIVVGIWGLISQRKAETAQATGPEQDEGDQVQPTEPWYARLSISAIILLTISALVGQITLARGARDRLRIDCYSHHEMWQPLLKTASVIPPRYYDVYAMHEVNKALYHAGRLPYRMFYYPQSANVESLMLSSKAMMRFDLTSFKSSGLFFKLGRINLAEQIALETIEEIGEHPTLLKQLARTNILKGHLQNARIFLSALAKHPIYEDWAKDYLRSLDENLHFSSDNELNLIRSRMILADYTYGALGTMSIGQSLEQLLARNKKNKMAFEYLMAHYLLARKVDKLAENITRLDDFDYSGIPTHYAEALLIYMEKSRKMPDLHGRRISGKTIDRYRRFVQTISLYMPNRKAASDVTASSFGDSYFYYYLFGFSASGAKAKGSTPLPVTGATK